MISSTPSSAAHQAMNIISFDKHYALYLLLAVGWTILFSMTIKQPVRGLRNFGILACYILAVIMVIRLPFVTALATWCVFGLAGAVTYIAYQLVSYARDRSVDRKLNVTASTFTDGLVAWPIMIPEAIEYLLAELGILRTPKLPTPAAPEVPPTVLP